MADQTKRFLVTEIDKAVNQKFNLFGGSAAQKIIQFLLLNNRKHVVEEIYQRMLRVNTFGDIATSQDKEAELRQEEKQAFIDAVIATSSDVFKLPVLSRGMSVNGDLEPHNDYKVRLQKFYEDLGLVNDLKLMREYKNLVCELFREFGYKAPEYSLLGKDRYADLKQTIKRLDLGDSEETLKKLVKFAAKKDNQSKDSFIQPYKFKSFSNVLTELNESDLAKLRVKKRKKLLLYFSLFAGLVLGLGEAFAPAKFYLSLFTSLGLTGVGFPFAAVAFVAAICVNSILMQGAVYNTFKELIFKNRFNKDAKGKELPLVNKIINRLVWGLSVFAALTIAGLSFAFSGFGVVPAAFISLMTFICFKSLLTNSVMKLMSLKVIDSALDAFKSLITEPFAELKANKFRLFTKEGLKSLFKLVVNSAAATAMVGFGASVVAASFVMFTTALAGMPVLAAVFGSAAAPMAANVIVGLAELTLGTFFVINVSTFIDTVRKAVLGLPNILNSVKDSLFTPQISKVESSENYIQHPLRNLRVVLGNLAGAVLANFAILNACGFGFGYKALFKNPLVGSVAGLSYVMSSTAGNLIPALKIALARPGLHTYSNSSPEKFNAMAKYQPEKNYRANLENTVSKEAVVGHTGFSPRIPRLRLSVISGKTENPSESHDSRDSLLSSRSSRP